MTIIGIVRHGVTDWNQQGRAQGQNDVPLNAEGIRQAEVLSQRLSEEAWDMIYSSDLLRASVTADMIAAAMGKQVNGYDVRLREKTHGRLDGTTVAERVERWGENWQETDHGEEKDSEMLERSLNFLDEMSVRFPTSKILVVSHGAWIRVLFEELFKDMEITFLDNTCVTVIEKQTEAGVGGTWNCLLFNCTNHLQQLKA